MAPNILTLDVSGRKFRTTKAVLSISPYFESLFARWEDSADRQPDGSYFVDANPDVFEHLLNFMRRPSRFPLYWTKENGFDLVLYTKVEAEADYFMLEGLRDWIKEEKYMEVISIGQKIIELGPEWSINNGTAELQQYILKGAVEQGGPKRSSVHIQAQDKLIVVKTEVIFDPEALINKGS